MAQTASAKAHSLHIENRSRLTASGVTRVDFFSETLITVQTTETSLRMSFGNSGRIGRSIIRAVSVAFSLGRPSRLR